MSNVSPSLLFPLLPTAVADHLSLVDEWYKLPQERRAPIRSVAMFDIVKDSLFAIIFDTVNDQLIYRFREERIEQLLKLYEGMRGKPGEPFLDTLVVSAPRRNPTAAARRSLREARKTQSDEVEPPVIIQAVESGGGGGGPKGIVAFLHVVAELSSLAAQASLVTVNGSEAVVVPTVI